MNLKGKMKKLQTAIVKTGLVIKINTNQFYSDELDFDGYCVHFCGQCFTFGPCGYQACVYAGGFGYCL